MVLKKDKQKVLDEVWTEERIRSFLEVQPPAEVDADFHRVFKAYQSMRSDDFAVFIDMAREAGVNLHATNANGQTVAQIAALHRNSAEFVAILQAG